MENLILSPAPHIHTKDSSRRIMLDVIIALLPAAVASVVIFGVKALGVLYEMLGSGGEDETEEFLQALEQAGEERDDWRA